MKIVIIANPIAGGGRAFSRLRRFVARWPHPEWQVELLPTSGPEHAGRLALELVSNPPDVLAVSGGDGTMNEIACHVPDPPFPIALLPAGTANVLARELCLPLNPVTALETALKRVVRRVDLAKLSGYSERRFLLMAGIGLDADIAARVRPAVKNRIGRAAYYLAALQSLVSYPFPEFEITTEAGTEKGVSCIIANARNYGGGLVLTPEADMSDGVLDVLVLERRSRFEYSRFLLTAWLKRPRFYPWIHCRRARQVTVAGARGACVQVDGEPAGALPVDVSVTPACFPLVVPEFSTTLSPPRRQEHQEARRKTFLS